MRGFRVWSNYWKKYATEAELYMDGSVDAIFEDDDGVPRHDNTDLVVEFNTGLKDKNGKEIYEGDIVEFKLTKRLYAVTYRRYDASFILENDEWEETIHLSLDKDDFEIIGNIHENPEALGEPKNTYREEFNRLTHDCSAVFCFGLLAHAMGLSEYHAIDIVKNAKEEHYQKAISLYKSMMDVEEE